MSFAQLNMDPGVCWIHRTSFTLAEELKGLHYIIYAKFMSEEVHF